MTLFELASIEEILLPNPLELLSSSLHHLFQLSNGCPQFARFPCTICCGSESALWPLTPPRFKGRRFMAVIHILTPNYSHVESIKSIERQMTMEEEVEEEQVILEEEEEGDEEGAPCPFWENTAGWCCPNKQQRHYRDDAARPSAAPAPSRKGEMAFEENGQGSGDNEGGTAEETLRRGGEGPPPLPSPPPSPGSKHRLPRDPIPLQATALTAPAALLRLPLDLALLLTPPLSPVGVDGTTPSDDALSLEHTASNIPTRKATPGLPPLACILTPRYADLPRGPSPRPASPMNPFQAHLLACRNELARMLPKAVPQRNPHLSRLIPRSNNNGSPTSASSRARYREDSFEDTEVAVWHVTPLDAATVLGGEDDEVPDLRRWVAGKRTLNNSQNGTLKHHKRRREACKSTLRIELKVQMDVLEEPILVIESLALDAQNPRHLPFLANHKYVSMPSLSQPKPKRSIRARAPSLPCLVFSAPPIPSTPQQQQQHDSSSDSESDIELPRSPSPVDEIAGLLSIPDRKHRRRHSDSVFRRLEEEERMASFHATMSALLSPSQDEGR